MIHSCFRLLINLGSVLMDSESIQVVIVTVLSVLVIVDIIGNSLVCVVITRNQDMRYVKTKRSII